MSSTGGATVELDHDGRSLVVTAASVVIGRHRDCAVRVTHPLVSREHCRIELRREGAYLEDLGAMNGTFLNGTPVKASVRLKRGDEIGLGRDGATLVVRTAMLGTRDLFEPEPEQATMAQGDPRAAGAIAMITVATQFAPPPARKDVAEEATRKADFGDLNPVTVQPLPSELPPPNRTPPPPEMAAAEPPPVLEPEPATDKVADSPPAPPPAPPLAPPLAPPPAPPPRPAPRPAPPRAPPPGSATAPVPAAAPPPRAAAPGRATPRTSAPAATTPVEGPPPAVGLVPGFAVGLVAGFAAVAAAAVFTELPEVLARLVGGGSP